MSTLPVLIGEHTKIHLHGPRFSNGKQPPHMSMIQLANG